MKRLILSLLAGSAMQAGAYSPNELVASVIVAEAGAEKDSRAMYAIMEVIRNRAEKKNKSFVQIVQEKWQFSCLNGVPPQKLIDKSKKHSKFKKALAIVNGPKTNFTDNATHYFADYIPAPSWSKKMKKLVKIEKHIFFRE